MIEFRWGTATDVGRVRSANQDQLLTVDPVFVVADGMGGHNGGEVAAAIAVDEMAKVGVVRTLDELSEAVQVANREIVDRSKLEPGLRGMGTTLVALVGMTTGDVSRLGVANVGDSRLYLRGADELVQVTEDHTLVEALVRDGRLTAEEALDHPQRNIVTRALGIDDKVLVDTWELAPVAGDRYLLCSDGLFNELTPAEILAMLRDIDDPSEAAVSLVNGACDAGGRDNVTVVIVDVVEIDRDDDAAGTTVDDVPADRVVSTRKAVPDSVLRVDPPVATGPNDPHPDEILVDRRSSSSFFTWRLGLFVATVLLVLGILASSVVAYARSAYFVGIDGETVVIYRGRPDGVLWFDPTLEEPLTLTVSELDSDDLDDVAGGVEFDTLDEARAYADVLLERAATDDP
ncbi:MAG: protein phosphatase 2C domain-containing protein [Acidimicrobiales bacterium]